MTDDDAAVRLISFGEVSSQLRDDSEGEKEVRCDVTPLDTLGRLRAVQIERQRPPGGNAFEALALLAEIEDVGGIEKRSVYVQRRIAIRQPNNSLGTGIRQRPNQYREHYAEDRSIGAYTEREHECCEHHKTPAPQKCATRVAQILPGIGEGVSHVRQIYNSIA